MSGYRRTSMSDVPGLVAELGKYIQAYRHSQLLPLSSWTITHDLDAYPGVTVTDAAGKVVIAEVVYESANRVVLNFSEPFAGFAYLS